MSTQLFTGSNYLTPFSSTTLGPISLSFFCKQPSFPSASSKALLCAEGFFRPQKVPFLPNSQIIHPSSQCVKSSCDELCRWALRTNLLFYLTFPQSAHLMGGHLRNVWMVQLATCNNQTGQTYQMWAAWSVSLPFSFSNANGCNCWFFQLAQCQAHQWTDLCQTLSPKK